MNLEQFQYLFPYSQRWLAAWLLTGRGRNYRDTLGRNRKDKINVFTL